jgi:hypothetical protein
MIDDENISKLYQRGKQQTPPAHLDDSILNAARDAVSKGKVDDSAQINDTAKSPFSGGWSATISVAAVLIITVILVPLINNEPDSPMVKSPEKVIVDELINKSLKKSEMMSQEKSLAPPTTISSQTDNGSAVMTRRVVKQRVAKQQPALRSESAQIQASNIQSKANDAAGARVWSTVLPSSAPLKMESSVEAESMQALPRKALLAEKKARFKRNEMSSTAMSLADEQNDERDDEVAVYGAKPGKMQPKKWLEKISLLLDAADFKQADAEVEEFRRCYPDEVIGESLLNRLSRH